MSRAWTWHPCGSIAPGPAATSARFSPSGRRAYVRDENDGVAIHDVSGDTPAALLGQIVGPLLYAPDDTLLVRVADAGPRIVLRPVPGPGPTFTFDYPATRSFCDSESIGFSTSGEYFQAAGAGSSCVWRTSDGALVAATLSDAAQIAVSGDTQVMLVFDGAPGQNAQVVRRDFSGAELGRARLEGVAEEAQQLVLSPAGDRIAGARSGRLWDTFTGAEILVPASERSGASPAIFGATGQVVWLGDGVFRARDGERIATIPRFNRTQLPLDLAPDGRLALASQYGGVAALCDVTASGVLRMLGPPTIGPSGFDAGRIASLEIAADGETLVMGTRYGASFGLRIAPRFEDSKLLSSMYPWIAALSAGGRVAASSGDQRAIYDVTDGTLLLGGREPTEVVCWGTRLRPSPSGQWAAGAGYEGKLDVFSGFSRSSVTANPWPLPFVSLHAGCFDTAAFTRDERLMATSEPALFRTGSAPEDWQRIWRADGPARGNGGSSGDEYSANDVVFSPDETSLLVSRCDDETCDVRLYDVANVTPPVRLPSLTAPHPSFSPAGEWIVDGGTLLHARSGEVRALDPAADVSVAAFAPNGDVIAGAAGGIVTRYCRTP